MPQENVDVVRRVFEAASQRDAAAVSELYDADVEWDSSGTLPGEVESGGGARGYEGLQAWFRQYELRDRKIRHCRSYLDPREALEAVGLSE